MSVQDVVNPPRALSTLIALSLAAGQAIAAAGPAAHRKADGSWVTEADHAAEAVILAGLRRDFPDIPILAEEQAAAGATIDCGPLYFCVDPLDGTRGFVEDGHGEYTVNIALVADGAPVLGAIHAPALGVTWWGGPDGAFRAVGAGSPQPIRSAPLPPPKGPWRIISSRREGGGALERFAARLGPHTVIARSSSLKLCLLAEGAADVYPRFGPVSLWDVAAGEAILAAAGGVVRTPAGAPIAYRRTGTDFSVNGFLAAASPAAADAALAAFSP